MQNGLKRCLVEKDPILATEQRCNLENVVLQSKHVVFIILSMSASFLAHCGFSKNGKRNLNYHHGTSTESTTEDNFEVPF